MSKTILKQILITPSARALLAANVLSLRQAKGWSQETLAFECGLHRTFIAHVERQARNISLDNVERIASALGLETFQLLKPQASHFNAPEEVKS